MRRFEGRVAAVTGAASGIGRGTSVALAQRGCDVALADVDGEGLRATAVLVEAAGRRATTHEVDVANRDAMWAYAEEVCRTHGGVHIVVNNAGVSMSGPLEHQSFDQLEWIVGINFWGVVHGCKFFLPHLLREDEAHIVNLSSLYGIVGAPLASSYCATKFAVRGLSEALWTELRRTHVGVTTVHPGRTATNVIRNARGLSDADRQHQHELFQRTGMSPEQAGRRIVRAIARNRMRLCLGPTGLIGDWLKRAFPTTTQRLMAWGSNDLPQAHRQP